MDDRTVAELKEKHGGDLTLLEVGGAELVVKKPTRAQFNRFREFLANGDGRSRVEGGIQLLRDTLVYPAWEDYLKIAERTPAIEDEIVGEVGKLAKAADKVTAKKL